MRPIALFVTLCATLLVAGCPKAKPKDYGKDCGFGTQDWCDSPAGDPCGRYKNVGECRADARCKGMAYRGESAVACVIDPSGFATNCPTVGCISR